MKQTNYHLFDFLDFDPELNVDESLWKAGKPTEVAEVDGEIHITVPFQKQLKAADMAADSAVAPISHTLRIRAYGSQIVRLQLSADDRAPREESEMLDIASWLVREPLKATLQDEVWQFTDTQGKVRG